MSVWVCVCVCVCVCEREREMKADVFCSVFNQKEKKSFQFILWKTIALMQLMYKKNRNSCEIQCDVCTHHDFSVCLYEYASHVKKSSLFWWGKHLEGFGEKLHICVLIFLVHYLEDSTDSVSSNLSDLEEDYYLLLYPLFSPASNSTPHWLLNCVRETKRTKGNWQMGQYLTTNKSSMRTSSNNGLRVMQRQLVECQNVMSETVFPAWSSVLTKLNIFCYVLSTSLLKRLILIPVPLTKCQQFNIPYDPT